VDVCIAGEGDLTELARLLWWHAAPAERKSVPVYERLGFASSRQLLQRVVE